MNLDQMMHERMRQENLQKSAKQIHEVDDSIKALIKTVEELRDIILMIRRIYYITMSILLIVFIVNVVIFSHNWH